MDAGTELRTFRRDHFHRGFTRRLCLGRLAITWMPIEIDDLMDVYRSRSEGNLMKSICPSCGGELTCEDKTAWPPVFTCWNCARSWTNSLGIRSRVIGPESEPERKAA